MYGSGSFSFWYADAAQEQNARELSVAPLDRQAGRSARAADWVGCA